MLADGHHRFETASTYAAERDTDDVEDPGAHSIMALVVELAPDELWVQPIHRMITGINAGALRDGLAECFDVRPAGANVPEGVAALEQEMTRTGALGLVDGNGLALLVPRPELGDRLGDLPEAIRDVDAARFDVGVLPVLGDAEVTYRHDAAATAAHVDKGPSTPRSCCARSPSTRSAPRPTPACGCRRRRRSSRRSHVPGWCSAASTS